jgi:hypothetical protein
MDTSSEPVQDPDPFFHSFFSPSQHFSQPSQTATSASRRHVARPARRSMLSGPRRTTSLPSLNSRFVPPFLPSSTSRVDSGDNVCKGGRIVAITTTEPEASTQPSRAPFAEADLLFFRPSARLPPSPPYCSTPATVRRLKTRSTSRRPSNLSESSRPSTRTVRASSRPSSSASSRFNPHFTATSSRTPRRDLLSPHSPAGSSLLDLPFSSSRKARSRLLVAVSLFFHSSFRLCSLSLCFAL